MQFHPSLLGVRLSVILIVSGLLWLPTALSAQSNRKQLAYAGNNLWNPGLSLSLEQRLGWKAGESAQWYRFAEMGGYHDPRSHTAVYGLLGVHLEKSRKRTTFWGVQLAPLGLYRSFYPSTYAVTQGGEVEQVSLAGRWYLAPSAQGEFGKYLMETREKSWFLGIQGMLLLPYNTYVLPLLFIKTGVRF